MPLRVKSTMSEGQQTAHTSRAKHLHDRAGPRSSKGVIANNEPQDCVHHWEKDAYIRDGMKQYQIFKEDYAQPVEDDVMDEESDDAESHESTDSKEPQIKKRGAGANQSGPNKKPKTKDTSKAAAGDKTRVPEKGQTVSWKTIQGFTEGEVVEIVYEEKTVAGKAAKGSMEDPRVVVKSRATGTVVVHKPEAVLFD